METRVFESGNSKAVWLPKEFDLPCGPISIRKEGGRIILEELSESGWPAGFFESVRISRKDFGRESLTSRDKTL